MPVKPIDRTPKLRLVDRFSGLPREDILLEVRMLSSAKKGVPTPIELRRHFGLKNNDPIDTVFGNNNRLLSDAKVSFHLYSEQNLMSQLSIFVDRLQRTPTPEEIDRDLEMPAAVHYLRLGGISKAMERWHIIDPTQVSSHPLGVTDLSTWRPLSVTARTLAEPMVGSGVVSKGDEVQLENLLPVLADGQKLDVLLRHLWRRDRARLEGDTLPNYMTLYVHMDPTKTTATTMTVMDTLEWTSVWSRRLHEGEARHYIKYPGADHYSYAGTDGSDATIQKHLSGGQVFAPDGTGMMDRAEKLRPKPEGFTPLADELCKNEPLITLAELKKVESLVILPVKLKNDQPGFVPSTVDWKKLAVPPSIERPSSPSPLRGEGWGEGENTEVDLPLFVGSDSFLPEPPLGMIVAGYGILSGGVLLGVAASTVEIPSGVAASVVRGVQIIINSGRPILAY